MKAKELAELLLQYPDFDVRTALFESDGSNYGMGLRTFEVVGIEDIGHSDKVLKLDILEEV